MTAPNGSQLVTSSGCSYNHISTSTTTVVKSTPGILHTLNINNPGSGATVTIYDNTAGSGTVIAIYSPSTIGSVIYDIATTIGLTIVTTATTTAADITVSYQ